MLVANRIISCQSAVPKWIQSFGVSCVFTAETTIVDPKTKRMILKSRNITGSSMLVVEETCVYSQHPEREEWTSYKQEAKISAFLPFIYDRLENHSCASFREKSQLGLQAIEKLSERIREEGERAIDSLIDNFTVFADNAGVVSLPDVSLPKSLQKDSIKREK
jgi:hypothetical protein